MRSKVHGGINIYSNLRSDFELFYFYSMWNSMRNRCYNIKAPQYKWYSNVYVQFSWKWFHRFYNDRVNFPNYFLAKKDNFKGWSLDKDIRVPGSREYNINTVSLVKISDNIKDRNFRCSKGSFGANRKAIIGVDISTGKIYEYDSVIQSENDGFNHGCVSAACRNVYYGTDIYKNIRWRYK